MKTKIFAGMFFSCLSFYASAELKSLDEHNMSEITGQGGVYLSGEFAINKENSERLLWSNGTRDYYRLDSNGNLVVDNSLNPDNVGNQINPDQCDNGICGLRFAIKLNENSEGWYVLDDVSGSFSFEGITLRTEKLTVVSDFNNITGVDVDGVPLPDQVTLADPAEVLKIGLPGKVSFKDFKFKYAVANNGEFGVPVDSDTPFRQTEIFGVQLNGDITLQGNLLLFPVN
ncbi:MAG: hypothetical protein P1U57_11315 [Oleibacter sp.]|nr:hypothetical protein [Thalassolituus sp.]